MSLTALMDQTFALTLANMKSRYRNTIAGIIWVVLSPIIMYGAQSYAFGHVLKVDIQNFNLHLLLGLLPWLCITQSIQMSATMLVNSGALLKSYNIHPFVIIAAQALDNLVNFSLAFLMILLPLAFYSEISLLRFWLLILPVLSLILFVLASSWIISIATVFFRDTAFVIGFLLSISFFLTPIFYDINMVDERIRWLVKLNLFFIAIQPFQKILTQDMEVFWQSTFYSGLLSAGLVVIAFILWKRKRNDLFRHL
jgi:ABC-type polysaccharide/polyol phosphate export permease